LVGGKLMPMNERMRLTIELDTASDPVRGMIGAPEDDFKPFSGYVQLIAALEGFRALEGVGELGTDGYRGERVGVAS
jgi:hypothetical protein